MKILVDTREQRPFSFSDYLVPEGVEVQQATLHTGDYSLDGLAHVIAIERKSLADLYGSLSHGRDRFQREMERLDQIPYAYVVCEADWPTILEEPPTRMEPKCVFRTVVAWQQRFPRVHWWMCQGRSFAECVTFRLLEMFHRHHRHAT